MAGPHNSRDRGHAVSRGQLKSTGMQEPGDGAAAVSLPNQPANTAVSQKEPTKKGSEGVTGGPESGPQKLNKKETCGKAKVNQTSSCPRLHTSPCPALLTNTAMADQEGTRISASARQAADTQILAEFPNPSEPFWCSQVPGHTTMTPKHQLATHCGAGRSQFHLPWRTRPGTQPKQGTCSPASCGPVG